MCVFHFRRTRLSIAVQRARHDAYTSQWDCRGICVFSPALALSYLCCFVIRIFTSQVSFQNRPTIANSAQSQIEHNRHRAPDQPIPSRWHPDNSSFLLPPTLMIHNMLAECIPDARRTWHPTLSRSADRMNSRPKRNRKFSADVHPASS